PGSRRRDTAIGVGSGKIRGPDPPATDARDAVTDVSPAVLAEPTPSVGRGPALVVSSPSRGPVHPFGLLDGFTGAIGILVALFADLAVRSRSGASRSSFGDSHELHDACSAGEQSGPPERPRQEGSRPVAGQTDRCCA